MVRRAARRYGDSLAVTGSGASLGPETVRWSYAELDRRVEAVAAALVDHGVRPASRVAMRLPPSPEAVVLVHAVWRAGGVLVPLGPAWTASEIARGLEVVGPPALIFESVDRLVEWGPESVTRAGSGDFDARGMDGDADRPAAILLTSGSTGAPQPVSLTTENLRASAAACIGRLGLSPEDRWLTSLSPAHVGGLTLIHRAAAVGCALVAHPRFDVGEVAELIDRGEVTHASFVPVMLRRVISERDARPAPDSLRIVLVGGARTPEPLLDEALGLRYPVALTYGLTEASSQVATAPPALVRQKPGTVGAPLESLELRLADPDEAGRGEILVRGPTVASPSRDTGDRTPGPGPDRAQPGDAAAAVRVDAEGWLHTGDLGRIDSDGHLWVTGRRSDRVVTGGVTVEPAEVEAVLARCPGVREICVVGAPDGEWGERLVAVVVASDALAPPSLSSLLAYARERLSPPKRPRDLRVVDRLPTNRNGKVDRARIGRMLDP